LSNDVVIRTYIDGDARAIVDILTLTFSSWRRNNALDYWTWKYLATPLKSLIVVGVKNDNVIGVQHNIFLNVKLLNSIITCTYGCDTAIHPDYRGLRVFSSIQDFRDNKAREMQIKFTYSQSRNPIILKRWEKAKRVPFPHPVSYMIKIKDIDAHLVKRPFKNPILTKIGFIISNMSNRIDKFFSPKIKSSNDYVITEALDFNDYDNMFWLDINKEYNFIVEKNNDYLNWRYDKRGGNYFIKKAINGEKVLGYIVMEIQDNDGYREGFVVDLLTYSQRIDVAYDLLKEACKFFDGVGVNVIYYATVKKHPFNKMAKSHSFLDSGKTLNIGLNLLDANEEIELLKAKDPSTIYFSYADSL
jgi:hypothetical protein